MPLLRLQLPQLRLRRPRPRLPGGAARLILALAAIFACCILYLVQISDVASRGYAVQDLAARRDRVAMQNEQLRAAVAEAKSLDRIESQARARGLGPPTRIAFVTAIPTLVPPTASTPTPETDYAARLRAWLRGVTTRPARTPAPAAGTPGGER